MRKEKLLKIALVLIMGTILVMMATNVFAADGDYQVDLTNTLNTNKTNTANTANTVNTTNTVKNTTTTNTNYSTNVPQNTNTNLPSTGIAENTMLFVAITVLIMTAIYAYVKFKYYKSI